MGLLSQPILIRHAQISYIQFICVLVFLGISDGLIPVMAYHFGAGKTERLQQIFRFTAKVNATIGVLVFIALQLWGSYFVSLFFQSGDHAVVQLATNSLKIFSWVFLMEGITLLIISYFTALGNAFGSMIIAALRGVIFIAIGMAILPPLFGTDGIWFTLIGSELLGLLAAIWLVKRYQGTTFSSSTQHS